MRDRVVGLRAEAGKREYQYVPIFSVAFAGSFLWLSKVSFDWPLIGGGMHLALFSIPIYAFLFSTTYQALRGLNHHVAESVTSHPIIRILIVKKASSFFISAVFALFLASSMLVFSFLMEWHVYAIVVLGFIVLSIIISVSDLKNYLKEGLAELTKGYLAVGVSVVTMVTLYIMALLFLDQAASSFAPGSQELIEHTNEIVNHPLYIFQSFCRAMYFFNASILGLGGVSEIPRWFSLGVIIVTTSAVPFFAMALFMRSVYELTVKSVVFWREH